MALLSFWTSNPAAVDQLNIEQIVSSAGDGGLKDQSKCSEEFRQYLGQVPTTKIAGYVAHCLSTSFSKGGMVLQDLVNELGRRLDYEVTNGRYQGVTGAIGFDGIWQSPEQQAIIVEVKTTDAYRLSLDTLARYRARLIDAAKITAASSALIVVGREDTGELEAQIRGSRHAWDVRLISVEALIKLVALKENSEAPETGFKIRSLLSPVEYTRLDRMVDVMFATATDVEPAGQQEVLIETSAVQSLPLSMNLVAADSTLGFTDASVLQQKREAIITAVGQRAGVPLVRKSRALYWNSAKGFRIACAMSKRYAGKNQNPYWYAFHPQWDDFLSDAQSAFFVLGCMDLDQAFAIPHAVLKPLLPQLHTTTKEAGSFWHIHLRETANGLELLIPKSSKGLNLSQFSLPVPS